VYDDNKSFHNRDDYQFCVQVQIRGKEAYLHCGKGKFDRQTQRLIIEELKKLNIKSVIMERHGKEKHFKLPKNKITTWLASWSNELLKEYK
jgi:hypothetical protein